MKRVYFDTEFYDDGKSIQLISIGMVMAEAGVIKTYYAETLKAEDLAQSTEWLSNNVWPGLRGGDDVKSRAQMAEEIQAFVGEGPVQFWAYYADYDWVALSQIFGSLMDRPAGWPMMCRDLRQWLNDQNLSKISQPDALTTHNALEDALWVYTVHDIVRKTLMMTR